MKFIRRTPEGLWFELEPREKRYLDTLLRLYPLLPATYHRATRDPSTDDPQLKESEALLQDALQETLNAHRTQLEEFWFSGRHLLEEKGRFRFCLNPERVEWFLQVLNDLRVGSWSRLGSPVPGKSVPIAHTAENLRYLVAIELIGSLQMQVLTALEHSAG